MNSKNRLHKICLITLIALFVILSFSSCKKKDSGESNQANPSALVNQERVINSSSSSQSIVNVPLPKIEEEKVEEKKSETPVESSVVETPVVEEKPVTVTVAENEKKEEEVVLPKLPSFVPVEENNKVIVEVDTPIVSLTPISSSKVEETITEEVVENEEVEIIDSYSVGSYNASITSTPLKTVITFSEPYPSFDVVGYILDKVVEKYPSVMDSTHYEYDGKVMTISYPYSTYGETKEDLYKSLSLLAAIAKDSLEEIEANRDEDVISREYLLYGKKVRVEADKEKAVITSSLPFTESEINEALEILRANFPEESKLVTYTLYSDRIELSYPEQNREFISAALDALNDLILAYTPMPLDEVGGITLTIEEGNEVKEEETKNEEVIENVVPITNAGLTIKNLSVGLTLDGAYDISSSPFVFGFSLRGEYALNGRFHVGAKVGYENKGYIPLKVYGKYYFQNIEELYVFGGVGANIGLGGNKTGFTLEAGLGYEIEVLDNIYVFGEAGMSFETQLEKKVKPFLSIGARYSF